MLEDAGEKEPYSRVEGKALTPGELSELMSPP
jgi:hypothetical protein